MSKQSFAWVDISGKIFVSDWEMLDRLVRKYPDRVKMDIGEEFAEQSLNITNDEMRETFEEVAQEKISAHFPSDEPIKFNEAIINMETYQSFK